MYNYLIDFRPVLLGAPLQLGALSAHLVRLWVNPALTKRDNYCFTASRNTNKLAHTSQERSQAWPWGWGLKPPSWKLAPQDPKRRSAHLQYSLHQTIWQTFCFIPCTNLQKSDASNCITFYVDKFASLVCFQMHSDSHVQNCPIIDGGIPLGSFPRDPLPEFRDRPPGKRCGNERDGLKLKMLPGLWVLLLLQTNQFCVQ